MKMFARLGWSYGARRLAAALIAPARGARPPLILLLIKEGSREAAGWLASSRTPSKRLFLCLALIACLFPTRTVAAADSGCDTGFHELLNQGKNLQFPIAKRVNAYKAALQRCPGSDEAYHDLAVLLLRQHDFQDALRWVRKGLEAFPADPDLNLDLAVALLSVGQPQQALSILQRLPASAKAEFYLGMAYQALRDHKSAQKAFAKSFALGDHDPYVLYALIEQDQALHDQEAGLKDFKTLYRTFPHSAWVHLLLGDAYFSQHNLVKAKKEYRRAIQLDRTLPIANFRAGFLDFGEGNYAVARQEFQREIALDPTFGVAYLYLGATLRRLGENPQSLPILRQAEAYDPNNPLVYRELAAAEIQAHQFPGALRTLQEGQRRFPKEQAFPAQLAQLLGRMGQARAAAKESQFAESLSRQSNVLLHGRQGQAGATPSSTNPPHTGGTILLGKEGSKRRFAWPSVQRESSLVGEARASSTSPAAPLPLPRSEQALGKEGNKGWLASPQIRQLSQCMEHANHLCVSRALSAIHDPTLQHDPDYLNLKAQALNLLHERTKALAAIQEAIRLRPRQEEYYITEGRIDQGMDNQKAAIQSFLYAEQLRPRTAGPVYDIGMSFFLLGNEQNDTQYYNRAGKHFALALQLDPKDDRAQFMLGVVEVYKFDLNEARKDFEQALQLNPRNAYYHLYYGVLLRRMGDRSGAVRELLTAERLDASDPRAYFNLGALYVQAGKDPAARKQLERAVQLDPKFAPAFYSLGIVYRNLGLTEKARASFQRFQQLKSRQQQEETDPVATSLKSRHQANRP